MSTIGKSASKQDGAAGRRGDGEIEIINRQRLYPIDQDAIAKLSGAVLDRIGRPDAVLTIIFTRDQAMRRLNRDYRGIDKPTDVLSFSYNEDSDHEGDQTSSLWNDPHHLGDVVISVETAERYARDLNLSFEREIDHLVIHGALHLAGYDHETDNGEMNKLERKLRKELLR